MLLRGYGDATIQRARDSVRRGVSHPAQRKGSAFAQELPARLGLDAVELRRCIPIDVGEAAPIVVNRYVVQHGDERSLVLYWYQSRDRVVASEYTAKFWVMADAIRLNRTDTALVRVVMPILDADKGDPAPATNAAVIFVQAFFQSLRHVLPS